MEIIHTGKLSLIKDFFQVVGVSLLIGLIALLSIPLPFTPVPIVLTLQAIIFFSIILKRKAVYATALYLFEGALGLPVFAGGCGGIAHLLGPTGGYLIGFVVVSYVVGLLAEQIREKSPSKIFAIMLFGNALVYVFGLPHLALFVGFDNALRLGLYPFIAVDLLKLMCAQRLLKAYRYFA